MRVILFCILLSLVGCGNKLEEKILNIPSDYDYYQCYSWKYAGDFHDKLLIPNGKFWGMIRYYNILGWERMTEVCMNAENNISKDLKAQYDGIL